MEDKAAAWLVKWLESGTRCSRVFLSPDEALLWAAELQAGTAATSCCSLVPLFERTGNLNGVDRE